MRAPHFLSPAKPGAAWFGRARVLCLALFVATATARPASAAPPRVHAIVGARIVLAPGQVIEHGTVVMRDGVITAVGAAVTPPPDARIWRGDSLTIYPGLIDAFVVQAAASGSGGSGAPLPGRAGPAQLAAPPRGAAHELNSVHPETRVIESLPLGKDQLESLRAAGFAVAQVAPTQGIVRGQSAVIELRDGAPNRAALKPDAAQVISLEANPREYPGSLMGAIAVIRQALMDAKWYRSVQSAYARAPLGKEPPETNLSWEALQPVVAGTQPTLFLADEMLEVLRSGAIAREAGVSGAIVTAGDEYKRVGDVARAGMPLIVPVAFPDAPDVSDPDLALEVTTEELRAWNDAPHNAAILAKMGVTFALTANGLKDVKSFRGNVAKAIARGLGGDLALAAVTTVPAKLLGLGDRLGTIAPGRIANLTVTRGELFSDKGKVREVWVEGERYEVAKDETEAKGKWTVGWGPKNGAGALQPRHALIVAADKDTTVKLVLGPDTLQARAVRLDGQRLRFTMQRGGEAPEDFDVTAANDALEGTMSVTGVGVHAVRAIRVVEAKDEPKKEAPPVETPSVMGNTEAWRMAEPPQWPAVLVRNATIWTAGPAGTLTQADLLVRGGKIAAVGRGLAAPARAVVIDATGKSVAPGIIDCHSHSAILGNVNECTHSVTAEVRIQDVVNSESVNIYRQLAGGTTIMHLLHGSCNAIGGQCAVIKNRWGAAPDRLLFDAAPPTIKFALGENPKQANFGTDFTGRYPQTRAGVEQVIRDAFLRARDYRSAQQEFKAGRSARAPKPDLQLDALVEIMEGRRFIHSHSYRQDEILMLMRLAEDLGFKVQTFQHVLEGYKVADEMAAHGAGGSTFSDWWGYKYEVIDAIPYNGYLMWDRGVAVSYNSDSDDLARRLNAEAAKAIKYGGVPPEEAIKFATLNPAKQLRIDARVGSLEVGKDADFTIWNGSPLSPYSHCEQTWIEGRKYFDRAADLAGREALAKEREALIARAREAKKEGGGGGGPGARAGMPPRYLEDTDMSGNTCGDQNGHGEMPFRSEAERRAAEVQR